MPGVGLAVAEPSHEAKQEGFVGGGLMLTNRAVGSQRSIDTTQELIPVLSHTSTLLFPAQNPVAVGVLWFEGVH